MDGHTDRRMYTRLLLQARPYWPHLVVILMLGLVGTPLSLLTPVPLKIVVDSAIGSLPLPGWLDAMVPANAGHSTVVVLLIATILLILTTLLVYLQSLGGWLLQTYTGEKLVLDFRSKLFRHLQRLSLAYHDTNGIGDSTYRIQNDAMGIQWVLISGAVPLITSAIALLGMIAVTARIDWQLALIALLVCPVLYVLTQVIGRRIRARWGDVKRLDSASMAIVQEVLAAVRVVKAFGREDHEQQRFLQQSNERIRGEMDLASLNGRFDLYISLTIAVGEALVLFVGVLHVKSGILTLGELLMVMAYLTQLYEPLKTISRKLTDLQLGLASAERSFQLLDEVPEVIERHGARRIGRCQGKIAFQNVFFSYRENQPVLHDVSFAVEPGARVGIQGRTGAGKTTLVSLLMRFYDPDSGQIRLDGVDLRDYALADLRNQFAIVLQDPFLFSTSIAENIAYGRPDASQSEIEKAANRANADEFIRRLPDGYATDVGERGMKLSGGERQRLSLARAFLKDAPVLILDEPTSSVDVKTEAAIMEAMERLMEGRTTFIIAHRLSTLDACDLRLEMDDGRLRAREERPYSV